MDEFYTVNQAAITLKVHPLTIRRYIKEGRLKAYRAGGNIRIAIKDLKDFTQSIDSHRSSSSTSRLFQGLSPVITNPFSFADPLFKVKGRGRSYGQ